MAVLRRSPLRLLYNSSTRLYHPAAPLSARLTIGIRREDPLRIWERRCPLTPDAVNELVEREDVDVLVQECDRRVWSTSEFVKAGAKVHSTLAPAHIILGIKETPLNEVLNDPAPSPHGTTPGIVPRTHLMFSHTIKGQLYNMELLSKYVSARHAQGGTRASPENAALLPRLVDYELLTGEDGRRTVGFGWFAGVAGALESLSALAHAHLELGVASPFLYTPRPHTRPSLESLRAILRQDIGARILLEGTPKSLGPIVFGVTGTGKVAQGVLDILADLPIEKVRVDDLPALIANPETDLRKIYLVHALPQDYFVRRDGGAYSRSDYYTNPQEYVSIFHEKIAPYLSLLLHGAGWTPAFPRMMTNEQLTLAIAKAAQIGRGRFACVGDISCDIEGGLEFLPHSSTLSAPFFSTRPPTLPAHLPSVTMMAVDILPTTLPLEASQHFSSVLLPYLRVLINEYRGMPVEGKAQQTKEALNRATVTREGRLTENFNWLKGPLKTLVDAGNERRGEEQAALTTFKRKKNVLMLGSGMVAGPAVEEICRRTDVQLLVASNSLEEATRLTGQHLNAKPVLIDMSDSERVGKLVAESDVVISLLPVPFHPSVAKLCIKHQRHLITASYISPDMRALHDEASRADVLLLNEIGLDPGIDHCSAVSLLDTLRAQGKEIVSFTSFCGGLPAPECANVPLGYKFSWSPKGVLSAALNGATFWLWNREHSIPGKHLLAEHIPDVPISNVLRFEGLANRDSLPYASFYGLGSAERLRTIFRGTLRYPGFSNLMSGFTKIGLLDTLSHIRLQDWTSLTRQALEERLGSLVMDDDASVVSAIRAATGSRDTEGLVHALRWLSLLPPLRTGAIAPSSMGLLPPVPTRPLAPIDLLAMILAHKLRYEPSERDMVVLHHEIVAKVKVLPGQDPATVSEETHVSSLIEYGTPKASAMARCVGLPVAFAALQVLDGGIKLRGVHGPTDRSIYKNVLARLEESKLGMTETSRLDSGAVEKTLYQHFRRNSSSLS